jgi:pimeloyl-ACP methyl ester carboxylesterase
MDAENVKEFGWSLAGEATLHDELDRTAASMVANVVVDPTKVLGDEWQLSEADRAVMRNPIVMQVMREAIPECVINGTWGWVDDDLAFVTEWGFDLDEIRVPVEVHYGTQDVLVPAAHGVWLAAHVPGAKVVVNDDQGHMNTPEHGLELLRTLVYDSTHT